MEDKTQTMPIVEVSETVLKALFYDNLVQKEKAEANMKLINDELLRRSKVVPAVTEETVTPEKTEEVVAPEAEAEEVKA